MMVDALRKVWKYSVVVPILSVILSGAEATDKTVHKTGTPLYLVPIQGEVTTGDAVKGITGSV